MAGGMRRRGGMRGRPRVCEVHGRGHEWQGGMHGGHAWWGHTWQ